MVYFYSIKITDEGVSGSRPKRMCYVKIHMQGQGKRAHRKITILTNYSKSEREKREEKDSGKRVKQPAMQVYLRENRILNERKNI